jgi:predicted secreted acid phosphatase
LVFLGFETKEMAPFHTQPLLMDKKLVVIFDLDETLLQVGAVQVECS